MAEISISNKQQHQFEEMKEDQYLIPQSVSYVHGLESGLNGSKHRYLTKNYKTCYFKSMEMSKWKLNKKNSFLRTLLKNFFRPSRAAEDSLRGCLNIQAAELKVNRPDLIVGSSWGGAIGLLLVSEGIWDGPIVLCCPALKHLLDKVGQTPNYKWNEIVDRINKRGLGKNILIIHGTSDKVVPYQTSLDAIQQIKDSKLITIEGGDHRLTDFIIKTDNLKHYINDHYKSLMLQQE